MVAVNGSKPKAETKLRTDPAIVANDVTPAENDLE
jgi:hypothetical protein